MLKPPKLLVSAREFYLTFSIFFILFTIEFLFIYIDYRSFVKKEFYFSDVKILNIYPKKSYRVLRVYSNSLDLDFFTTLYNSNLDLKIDTIVRLKLYPSSNLSFWEYLNSPYIKSKFLSIKREPEGIKAKLFQELFIQHKNREVIEFYQAIFLANPISKDFREVVSALGISHLIALSGFHLGILFGFLFFTLNLIYKRFQQRFFPYRYNLVDIGLVCIFILGVFLHITNSPPSLFRAYVMFIIGWLSVIVGLEVKSFELILAVLLVSLLVFPKLLFSISFWFSIIGVFYVFLILHHINIKSRYLLSLIVSILIFILMLPIIHMIFPLTSKVQLLSPILSILFTIFYPVSLVLHLFRLGDLFDKPLVWLFSQNYQTYDVYFSYFLGFIFIVLSIFAIFSRRVFYFLITVSLLFGGYIFIFF